ncbi:MAG: S8 family serine peptidase [Anaerolineae bacterium]
MLAINKQTRVFLPKSLLIIMLLAVVVGTLFISRTNEPMSREMKLSAGLLEQMATNSNETVKVLIQTEGHDYAAVIDAINQAGGTVTRQFKYANGIAAEIPASVVMTLNRIPQVVQISLDVIRGINSGSTTDYPVGPGDILPLGSDMDTIDAGLRAGAAIPLTDRNYQVVALDAMSVSDITPETYANPATMNAGGVWGTGNFGQDSLVVVIDTGIYADHFMLTGSVIGGIDISTDVGTPYEGFDLATNHWHGTHVSGIIAGHGGIVVPNDDSLVQSIELYTGSPLDAYNADNKVIWLLGMAPEAQLYGIKVFAHDGGGASESTIIAGLEHAIDLHMSGTDVDVINMSLGGPTLFDGRDLEDQVVDAATAAGITVVVAASNDGPASMTIASPGSSNTAVTVGAVAHPINTRVFWDQLYGSVGIGSYLFVDDNPQMVYFSSRGPTSDGRDKPTASAVGVFVLSSFNEEDAPNSTAWASGTSMATPAMAGVAALLNTYGETVGASPYDLKEAIIAGSSPLPGYEDFEQGAGFIDATAAMAALQSDSELGSVQEPIKAEFSEKSKKPEGTRIKKIEKRNGFTFNVENLAPGHAQHFYFKLPSKAERITVDFTNVELGSDPLGLNSFEFYLQSASRSFGNYYIDSTNVWGDATFVVEDLNTTASGAVFGAFLSDLPLMPGYVRLVVENDWTTFDNMSATVHVQVDRAKQPKKNEEFEGKFITGESDGFFPVGFGPDGVELELSWKRDWTRYPASDMDLIVAWFDVNGNLNYEFSGATLNSPELVRIESPDIAQVYVLVDAFNTNGLKEKWELEVFHLGAPAGDDEHEHHHGDD